MGTVELSAKERRRLEDTFRTTTDRRLRDRVQAVLMASGDRTQAQIAVDLLVSERSVRRWLQAWRAEGLAGLEIQWAPGATPLIEETLAPEILEWVRQGPTAFGLNRANWTSAELAEHLWRTHGVRVAERTMRKFLRKHDVRPYRPTYRFLRGDPDKQQAARDVLAELGEKSTSRRGRAAQSG